MLTVWMSFCWGAAGEEEILRRQNDDTTLAPSVMRRMIMSTDDKGQGSKHCSPTTVFAFQIFKMNTHS